MGAFPRPHGSLVPGNYLSGAQEAGAPPGHLWGGEGAFRSSPCLSLLAGPPPRKEGASLAIPTLSPLYRGWPRTWEGLLDITPHGCDTAGGWEATAAPLCTRRPHPSSCLPTEAGSLQIHPGSGALASRPVRGDVLALPGRVLPRPLPTAPFRPPLRPICTVSRQHPAAVLARRWGGGSGGGIRGGGPGGSAGRPRPGPPPAFLRPAPGLWFCPRTGGRGAVHELGRLHLVLPPCPCPCPCTWRG